MEMPIKSVTSILGEKRCEAKIGGSSSWVVRMEGPQVSIKREASCQVKRHGMARGLGKPGLLRVLSAGDAD